MDSIIPPELLKQILLEYLKEDIPSFDFGAFAVGTEQKQASLLCKASGVVSGLPVVQCLFTQILNCKFEAFYSDGDYIDVDTVSDVQKGHGSKAGRIVVAKVCGRACDLLRGERVALNLMARTSGISTLAHSIMSRVKEVLPQWKGCIAGTRKTTPGFRLFEKYALLVGGADCHRVDLSSMVMLKDNHIWSCGSISKAIQRVRQVSGFSLKVEVECRSYDEAVEAIRDGADVVMLDNFTPADAKIAADKIKKDYKHIIIEVSGGITKDSVLDYICDSIDVLSMGSLTQGVPHIDFSMKIDH
ncbi:hypothetical protein MP228_002662 [Amoeboaphelidium protococcarum]|nr:hypothetical protein MP228_002662 [Amoeboaphelidium protococcarum]